MKTSIVSLIVFCFLFVFFTSPVEAVLKRRDIGVNISSFTIDDANRTNDLVNEMQVGLVRIPFNWYQIQYDLSDKNKFDWYAMDANVASLDSNVEVLGILMPDIDWSGSELCHYDISTTCTNPSYTVPDITTRNRPSLAGSDQLWSDWDVYVYNTVARYGVNGQDKVRYWQILNEPDYFVTRNDGFTDQELTNLGIEYGQVLKRTVEIIRLADPDAVIVTAALSDYDGSASTGDLLPRSQLVFNGIGQSGALDVVDGFSIHPYRSLNHMSEYISAVAQRLDGYTQDQKKIWVTEFGFVSSHFTSSCEPYCQQSSATEADEMKRLLNEFFDHPRIEKVIWYRLNRAGTGDEIAMPHVLVDFNQETQTFDTSPKYDYFVTFMDVLTSDVNKDGKVDLLDFSLFSSYFFDEVEPGTGPDMDDNGIVNLSDYSILSRNFFKRR